MGMLDLECYADVDFAGIWGYEDPQDPHCIQSHTGFVILLGGCPILWTCKLQTYTALSTMDMEYISLSTITRDLLLMWDILQEICATMGLDYKELSMIKSTV